MLFLLHPIVDTTISVLCPVSRSGFQHWILKGGRLKSSGPKIISLNRKTKKKLF